MNRIRLRTAVIAFVISVTLLAPLAAQSSRRAIGNLLGRTDATGSLMVTSTAVAVAPFSARRAIGNLLGRTDASGNLMVAMDGEQTVSAMTVTQGTKTADSPRAISTTATWTNAAVTFTHWLANVTDTASGAQSKLLDMQVGGSSRISVRKDGSMTAAGFGLFGSSSVLGWSSRSFLSSTADGNVRATNNAQTNTFDVTLSDWGTTLSAEGVSVANDGLIYFGASKLGKLQCAALEDGNAAGEFRLNGITNTTSDQSGSSVWGPTKDTAAKFNIYYDAAGASGAGYYLQNKRGATRTLHCLLIGI